MAIGYADQISGNSFMESVQGMKHRLQLARTRRAAYNRTYRELSGMTDAELVQMKVSRSMIHQLAREAADLH